MLPTRNVCLPNYRDYGINAKSPSTIARERRRTVMDASRFDSLAKALAGRMSRRMLIRAAVAGGALSTIGVTRVQEASACTPPGPLNYCNAESECCSNAVCSLGICQCRSGFKQCGQFCVPLSQNCSSCPVGWQRCNDTCINVQNDRFNCGSCGHQCPANNICSLGHCCPKGLNWCNGTCSQGLCA
jgi:hypothetical protein